MQLGRAERPWGGGGWIGGPGDSGDPGIALPAEDTGTLCRSTAALPVGPSRCGTARDRRCFALTLWDGAVARRPREALSLPARGLCLPCAPQGALCLPELLYAHLFVVLLCPVGCIPSALPGRFSYTLTGSTTEYANAVTSQVLFSLFLQNSTFSPSPALSSCPPRLCPLSFGEGVEFDPLPPKEIR